MKLVKSSLFALLAIVLVGCGGNSIQGTEMATRAPSGVMMSAPTNYRAGETISFTVTITPAAVGDETVAISASPAGSFSTLPSSVVIPNGSSSVTFSATVSNTPPAELSVTANASGKISTRAMWGY